MSSVNILFFSNFCEGSKHLISLLEGEKLTRFFHLICTDNNKKIPPQIKVTPTIIIRGVPTPYVATDAFAWFAKVKQWKTNILMKRINTEQQNYLQSVNTNLSNDNEKLLGFSAVEMNGMSDIFSFFSKNIEQECQDPLPQSFFVCNNLGKDKIITPPLEGGSYDTQDIKFKISQDKQKKLVDQLSKSRKQQDILFKQNMENFRNNYNKKIEK